MSSKSTAPWSVLSVSWISYVVAGSSSTRLPRYSGPAGDVLASNHRSSPGRQAAVPTERN